MQRLVEATAITANIVPIQGIGEHNIRACIETLGKLLRLVIQVAFYLEAIFRAHRAQRILTGLRCRAKAIIHLQLATVRQMRDPACKTQTSGRSHTAVVVVAAMPIGIGLNELNLRRLNTNLPSRRTCADTHHQCLADEIRVHQ